MRYCSNCGTKNENDAKFCSGCGTMLEAAQTEDTQAAAETPKAEAANEATPAPEVMPTPGVTPAPAPQTDYQPYQVQETPEDVISAKGRTFGIIGFILALVSLVFCWLGVLPVGGIIAGFFMLACAIVGLVFCNISKREGKFKLANVGKVFAIIGICLAGLLWVIGFGVTASFVVNANRPNGVNVYDIGDINDAYHIDDIDSIDDIEDIYKYFNP